MQHGASENVAWDALSRMPPIVDYLAMNMTKIRNMRGLSQQALADMIGRDKATISRAEAQFDGTTLGVYKLCAKAIGVTLADIFSDDRSKVELQLIEAFRHIPEVRHNQILGLLQLAEAQPEPSPQENS